MIIPSLYYFLVATTVTVCCFMNAGRYCWKSDEIYCWLILCGSSMIIKSLPRLANNAVTTYGGFTCVHRHVLSGLDMKLSVQSTALLGDHIFFVI